MKKAAPPRWRVCVVVWNRAEAEAQSAALRELGFEAAAGGADGGAVVRAVRGDAPDAMVIDLRRLPSHGRDVALAVRSYKATRGLPLVFVNGDPAKTEKVRQLFPDAEFADWPAVADAVRRAVARPPAAAPAPSRFAGYSGAPLAKKLGIGEGVSVLLVGAPEGFEQTLGIVGDTVARRVPKIPVRRRAAGAPRLILWFVRSAAELHAHMRQMAAIEDPARLWIVWAKKTSPLASDATQNVVRAAGLAAGLVDYKICAIDADWTALLFKRRRPA